MKALRVSLAAVAVIAALAGTSTGAFAGTTGGINGAVVNDAGVPVAGAKVAAVSPTDSADTTTDATGHFVFLALLPDTYTVTVSKPGDITTTAVAGVTVIADQITRESIVAPKAVKTLGTVTVRSQAGVVRPGSTTQVYTVNAAATELTNGIGGNAYNQNTIYGVAQLLPGVSMHRGYYNNSFTIRGGESDQVGFEYDGIPVNRIYDNANAMAGSTVGMQELQVYTGIGPASAGAQASTGFVNQVIKSGSYPGFTELTTSLASPTMYNDLLFEQGGANANGRFSYYFASGSSDVKQREYTQFDGIGLYQWIWGINPYNEPIWSWGSDAPPCNPDGQDPFSDPFIPSSQRIPAPTGGSAGCIMFAYPPSLFTNDIQENRDNVLNLHFGIPHKNSARKDDLQILWDGGFQSNVFRTSVFDAGGLQQIEAFNRNYAITPFWTDSVQFGNGVQFGQVVNPNAPFPQIPLVPYKAPGSDQQFRCANLIIQIPGSCFQQSNFALVPGNARTGSTSQYGITKFQYTKNLTDTSYLRLYAYTLFSGYFTSGAQAAASGGFCCFAENGFFGSNAPPADYELSTHERGSTLQYVNQLTAKHLLTFTANYTTATDTNWSNSQANQGAEDLDGQAAFGTNLVSFDSHGNPTCYIYGYFQSIGSSEIGQPTSCDDPFSRGTFSDPAQTLMDIPSSLGPLGCSPCWGPTDQTIVNGQTVAQIYANSPAGKAGAKWIVTDLGPVGSINTVQPVFTSFALTDQFKPSEKWLITPGLRLEQQTYDLPTTNTPAYNFWFAVAREEFWYNPQTMLPIQYGAKGTIQPDSSRFDVGGLYASIQCPLSSGDCSGPGAPVHPDGLNGHVLYTNQTPASFTNTVFAPQIGATYTFNPDSVLRFDVGVGADPVASSLVEYLNAAPGGAGGGAAAQDFGTFLANGSLVNYLKPRKATNVDASFERHFKGTDLSMSITPFYRNTQDQYVSASSDTNTFARGLEVQLQKGSLDRNGWASYVAFTYTKETMKFLGTNAATNPIYAWNINLDNFNSLTRQGDRSGNKGSMCYNAGLGGPAAAGDCSIVNGQIVMTQQGLQNGDVINPFYLWAPQPYYDPNGQYYFNNLYVPIGNSGEANGARLDALSPYQFAGYLSYRHNKLQIAPNFVVWGGTHYGSPMDIQGVDPRTCAANQGGYDSFNPGVYGGGTDAYGNPFLPTDIANQGTLNYLSCGTSPLLSSLGLYGIPVVPLPYTHQFPSWGQYTNPWHLNLNATINYDLTPRTALQLNVDNIYNYCWGGSKEPWTAAYPPNQYICEYQYDPLNNYYYHNGKGPDDVSANGPSQPPYLQQFYAPVVDTWPFNLTLTAKIKI